MDQQTYYYENGKIKEEQYYPDGYKRKNMEKI